MTKPIFRKVNTPPQFWLWHLENTRSINCAAFCAEVLYRDFGVEYKLESDKIDATLIAQIKEAFKYYAKRIPEEEAQSGDLATFLCDSGWHIGVVCKTSKGLYLLHAGANTAPQFLPLRAAKDDMCFRGIIRLTEERQRQCLDKEYQDPFSAFAALSTFFASAIAATGVVATTGTLVLAGQVATAALALGAAYIGGRALINALTPDIPRPPNRAETEEASPTYSIRGGYNDNRIGQPLPIAFGEYRMFPDLIAHPYTYYTPDGSEQIWEGKLTFGMGELVVSDGEVNNIPLFELVNKQELNYNVRGDNDDPIVNPAGFAFESTPGLATNRGFRSYRVVRVIKPRPLVSERQSDGSVYNRYYAYPHRLTISQTADISRLRRVRIEALPAGVAVGFIRHYGFIDVISDTNPFTSIIPAEQAEERTLVYYSGNANNLPVTRNISVFKERGTLDILFPQGYEFPPGANLGFIDTNTTQSEFETLVEWYPETPTTIASAPSVRTLTGGTMSPPLAGENIPPEKKVRFVKKSSGNPQKFEFDIAGNVFRVSDGKDKTGDLTRTTGQSSLPSGGGIIAGLIASQDVTIDPGAIAAHQSVFRLSYNKDEEGDIVANENWLVSFPPETRLINSGGAYSINDNIAQIINGRVNGTGRDPNVRPSPIATNGPGAKIQVVNANNDLVRRTLTTGDNDITDIDDGVLFQFQRVGAKTAQRFNDTMTLQRIKAFFEEAGLPYPQINAAVLRLGADEQLDGNIRSISYRVRAKAPILKRSENTESIIATWDGSPLSPPGDGVAGVGNYLNVAGQQRFIAGAGVKTGSPLQRQSDLNAVYKLKRVVKPGIIDNPAPDIDTARWEKVADWVPSRAYSMHDYVVYGGNLYEANVNIAAPPPGAPIYRQASSGIDGNRTLYGGVALTAHNGVTTNPALCFGNNISGLVQGARYRIVFEPGLPRTEYTEVARWNDTSANYRNAGEADYTNFGGASICFNRAPLNNVADPFTLNTSTTYRLRYVQGGGATQPSAQVIGTPTQTHIDTAPGGGIACYRFGTADDMIAAFGNPVSNPNSPSSFNGGQWILERQTTIAGSTAPARQLTGPLTITYNGFVGEALNMCVRVGTFAQMRATFGNAPAGNVSNAQYNGGVWRLQREIPVDGANFDPARANAWWLRTASANAWNATSAYLRSQFVTYQSVFYRPISSVPAATANTYPFPGTGESVGRLHLLNAHPSLPYNEWRVGTYDSMVAAFGDGIAGSDGNSHNNANYVNVEFQLSKISTGGGYERSGGDYVWTDEQHITRNPAAAYRKFAIGEYHNGELLWGLGLSPEEIDNQALAEWYLFCDSFGLEFNGVFDSNVTTGDVLRAIAAAGRANMFWNSGRLSVVVDTPYAPMTRIFTDDDIVENGINVSHRVQNAADGVTITYNNEAANYERQEITIAGVQSIDENNNITRIAEPRDVQKLTLFGVTNETQARLQGELLVMQDFFRSTVTKIRISALDLQVVFGDVIGVRHRGVYGDDNVRKLIVLKVKRNNPRYIDLECVSNDDRIWLPLGRDPLIGSDGNPIFLANGGGLLLTSIVDAPPANGVLKVGVWSSNDIANFAPASTLTASQTINRSSGNCATNGAMAVTAAVNATREVTFCINNTDANGMANALVTGIKAGDSLFISENENLATFTEVARYNIGNPAFNRFGRGNAAYNAANDAVLANYIAQRGFLPRASDSNSVYRLTFAGNTSGNYTNGMITGAYNFVENIPQNSDFHFRVGTASQMRAAFAPINNNRLYTTGGGTMTLARQDTRMKNYECFVKSVAVVNNDYTVIGCDVPFGDFPTVLTENLAGYTYTIHGNPGGRFVFNYTNQDDIYKRRLDALAVGDEVRITQYRGGNAAPVTYDGKLLFYRRVGDDIVMHLDITTSTGAMVQSTGPGSVRFTMWAL